ncbi:MAG: hypothetical protein WCX71_04620 [Candidatus Buchananbacteria bacterium]
MFSTVHGTVGAIIGKATGNIFLGFAGGFLAHFLFDAIPHGDENLIADADHITPAEIRYAGAIGIIDLLVMIFLLIVLNQFGQLPTEWAVLSGMVGGLFPDFLNGCYMILKWKIFKPISDIHFGFHKILTKRELTLKQGLIVQTITLTIILGVLITF